MLWRKIDSGHRCCWEGRAQDSGGKRKEAEGVQGGEERMGKRMKKRGENRRGEKRKQRGRWMGREREEK